VTNIDQIVNEEHQKKQQIQTYQGKTYQENHPIKKNILSYFDTFHLILESYY